MSAGPTLRIMHFAGASGAPGVGGVTWTVDRLSLGQAVGGHLTHWVAADFGEARQPEDSVRRTLVQLPYRRGRWLPGHLDRLLDSARPDIVHLHSAFLPHNVQVAAATMARGIPFVIHHNGALAPEALRRGAWKKWAFSLAVQRRVFRRAAGTIGVTARDLADFRAYVAQCGHIPGAVIPNPAGSASGSHARSAEPAGRSYVAYLGRMDVQHKGIDRLAALAESVPDLDVRLYGSFDPARGGRELRRLLRLRPANLTLHAPVFGRDKERVLRGARAYVQLSRWEAFGISIAEAMLQGVPVILSGETNLGRDLRGLDAAIVGYEGDFARSLRLYKEALADAELLAKTGELGWRYARRNFTDEAVVDKTIAFYRRLLA